MTPRGLVISTIFSTGCLMTIVVVLPLFCMRMQWVNTIMRAQLHKCHRDVNEISRQLVHEGVRFKRQYNPTNRQPSGKCCSCQQGQPGKPGPPGKDGQHGSPGVMGANGRNGLNGKYVFPDIPNEPPCQKCPTAPPGPPGHPGQKGPRGNTGRSGTPGTPGIPGRVGPPGPMGIRGAPGEFGLQGPPGDLGSVLNSAPPGPPGKPGPIGPRGKAGATGRDGHPGVTGISGPVGLEGERGPKGVNGPPGPPGPKGSRGYPGSCSHCPPVIEQPTSENSEEIANFNQEEDLIGNTDTLVVENTSSPTAKIAEKIEKEEYKTEKANNSQPPLRVFSYKPRIAVDVSGDESETLYRPKPEEIKPSGYTSEQLSSISKVTGSKSGIKSDSAINQQNERTRKQFNDIKRVTTNQGYHVDVVGGYTNNQEYGYGR